MSEIRLQLSTKLRSGDVGLNCRLYLIYHDQSTIIPSSIVLLKSADGIKYSSLRSL